MVFHASFSQVSCPGSQVNCEGQCVDPSSDRGYCGAFGDCQGGDAGTAWFRDENFSTGNLTKGYGAGLHFLLPYSMIFRVEYAWNEVREGELIIDLGAVL